MKRIFPNVYSKVLKGKKSKCHHLVPRVCLCWHHTCAHIHFPQGSVRVSSLPELSKLSSLRFPEPGSPRPAPPPSRRAASLLTMHPSPHLTLAREPWATTTRPSQPHTPGTPSHNVPISPLNPPKAPSTDRGELQL